MRLITPPPPDDDTAQDSTTRGTGPWPVLFQQRYGNDGSDPGSTADMRELAVASGCAVGLVLFRGAHQSEGEWNGYRHLGTGSEGEEFADGYDTCEWLAAQEWCTGQVGTFGSSQGGFAQNFLAAAAPPSLVCQYMIDTGLSLYHEA